jgi:hypothetical protein
MIGSSCLTRCWLRGAGCADWARVLEEGKKADSLPTPRDLILRASL